MDPSVWSQGTPAIQDGDPVSAAVANAPHTIMSSKIEALKIMLDAIERGEQLVLRDRALADGIEEGDVVYFDPDTLVFEKAQAQWESLETAESKIAPAPSAMYAGVVLLKSAAQVGDILSSGIGTLDAVSMTVLFGSTAPDEGIYYLSALTPGTVTTTPPLMTMRVLEYLGSYQIRVLQPDPQPITHSHKSYTLDVAKWVSSALFDPSIVPTGATRGYSFVGDTQNLEEALLPAVGEAEFVYRDGTDSGKHVEADDILLDQNGIWWFAVAAPTGDMTMTVTVAETHGIAVLYSATSADTSITVETVNGRVTITYNEYDEEEETDDHIVVKELDDHKQKRGPVVKSLTAGTGLTFSSLQGQDDDGGWVGDVVGELTLFNDYMIPAQLLNLNNSVTAVDSPYVYTRFPQDRDSSVTCMVQLPDLSAATYSGYLYAIFMSPEAGQDPPDIEDVMLVPTPSASGVTPVAAAALAFPSFPGSVVAGRMYLLTASPAITLSSYSSGQIFFTLRADEPSAGLKMVSTGIQLQIVS